MVNFFQILDNITRRIDKIACDYAVPLAFVRINVQKITSYHGKLAVLVQTVRTYIGESDGSYLMLEFQIVTPLIQPRINLIGISFFAPSHPYY
jgi:hypothetical protein